MGVRVKSFDPRRAIAALMYLVHGASDDLYISMKMLYVADKLHLEMTGRFIAGDSYVAMNEGATPSGAYDIFKYVRGDHQIHRGLPEAPNYISVENNKTILLRKPVPKEFLSKAAIDCLDQVLALYKQNPDWGFWYQKAHDEAWTESRVESAAAPPMNVETIARSIPGSERLLDYLADPYPSSGED